jgi:Flp pilus assembly protein TadB
MTKAVLISVGLATIAGISLAVSTAAIFYLIINATPWGKIQKRLSHLANGGQNKQSGKSRMPFANINLNIDRRDLYYALAGFLCAVIVLRQTPVMLIGAGIGILVGPVVAHIYRWTKRDKTKNIKIRECAALYEAIDLYTQAGYTVEQSLRMGSILTPTIRPHIDRCLSYWPQGSIRALERLGGDLGIEEADILISVLMQAEKAGPERVAGLLSEESTKLEELRQTMAEIKIAAKPIYQTAYFILPLAANMGIVLSVLGYRLWLMIDGLKAGTGG